MERGQGDRGSGLSGVWTLKGAQVVDTYLARSMFMVVANCAKVAAGSKVVLGQHLCTILSAACACAFGNTSQ